jgi:exonuclease III
MPQTVQPGQPFKVVAVNVNGLAAAAKRRNFFAWLLQQRYAIVLLSETHSTSDSQGQQWVLQGAGSGRPWQGMAFFAHQQQQGARAAGGTAVLLSHRIVGTAAEPTVEHIGPSGRVLKVSWVTPWGQRMAAVAVYAPCTQQDRSDFFLGEYMTAVTTGTQECQIVGGDFNCVMRTGDILQTVQQQQQQGRSGRIVGGQDLRTVTFLAGLQDAWLQTHPGVLQPTHYTQHGSSSDSDSMGDQLPAGMSGGRLDYVFLSEDIINGGWLKAAHQHRRYPSDHRPVIVKLQPPDAPEPGPRRWRFPNHLLGIESAKEQLKRSLQQAAADLQQRRPALNPAEQWDQLKQFVQQEAKQLERQLSAHREADRRRLRQQVAAARRLNRRVGDPQSLQDLLAAEQALSAFEDAELTQHVVATEPLWEVYGETSSYYFHRLGKAVPEPQFIAEVQRRDGSVVQVMGRDGISAAGDALADFYDPATAGLFSCHPTDPQQQQVMLQAVDQQLSADEQQQCRGQQEDGSLTLGEAQAALASLPRGKSPGSDGLTYEFYTAMWDVVGDPLVAAFNYSFAQPELRLSQEQRLGLITLIYKGGGKPRADPASYRPITLLNCDLKIVAKVLVQRFGPAMEGIIDSTQTAFVPGRDIADNVLLHLEEIDYLQEVGMQQGQQGCILFLDFEKAYDRLDREWLFKCMAAMRFPESSMRWVRLLLAGTQGQVMFNGGHSSRVFDIPSGCAQGSPLSPLLYVIAAQPLAARCRQLQQQGRINSIRLPNGTAAPCSHQHADDTTLHGETVEDVATLLHHAVEPSCAASGAKLNRSKSQGMVLGAHPQLVGQHAATGVTFVDTTVQPIRHLGVLLSVRGGTAFAEQLFEQRLQSIGYRAKQWGRYDLTLIGRCEVARQVMASCLVYHAQFISVPDNLLRLIQRRVTAFILGLGCIRRDDSRVLCCRPAAAVASLPAKQGGIGQVDVRAHITAMQAKVAVALLHPHRQPWKLLMRASLERALPGLGVRALVQQGSARAAAGARSRLNPRHAAYLAAFRAMGLQRRIAHSSMLPQQVRLELVVGNYSVADATTGGLIASQNSLPATVQPRTAGVTLGQISSSLSYQPAVDQVVMPAAWQQTLQQPVPAGGPWQVDTQQRWVMQYQQGISSWYAVQADGSLVCLDTAPDRPPGTAFVPCCAVYATKGGPRKQPQQQQEDEQQSVEAPSAFYLVGPWAEVKVDPTVWGFGKMGLLQYTVKAATQRLVRANCRGEKGWVPGWGMRPRLWRDEDGNLSPATGLEQLERTQKRTFAQMMQQGFSSSSQRRFEEADVAAGVHANWMDPSPPRLHPRQRAAAAAAATDGQLTSQRQLQQLQTVDKPAVDDTVDPLVRGLTPASQDDLPWVTAYRSASDKRLPRTLRVFGYKLLHAALGVGSARIHAAQNMQQLLDCCCKQRECQPQQQQQQHHRQQQDNQPQQQQQQQLQQPAQVQREHFTLESLTHLFVSCPVAAAAWAWFARVWARVQPGTEIDVGSVSVLLLDDRTAWQPPAALQQLWTYLRLLLLESIWVVVFFLGW